ncbi:MULTISPECIES: sensor histidine kinase [unclassified Plantibacter]|uniref:sensor histidine kinase n=1 Tax=unclassified Plantibacter TaxID=2624265 RepID=UPI0009EA46FF|nr:MULTISPECIES: sensor histidine kinase [unclassified Plantibacter]
MSDSAAEQHEERPVDPYDAEWRRPPATAAELRSDVVLAIALGVGTLLSLTLYTIAGFYAEPAPMWASVLWAIGITAPLAFRRRAPCTVSVIVGVMFIIGGTVLVPEVLFTNIALFMAIYTVGAWVSDRRRAVLVRVLIIFAMFAWLLVYMFIQATDPYALPNLSRVGLFSPLVAFILIQILTNILYFGGAYFFGERAYQSARERAVLEARTIELEQERARSARQAVALERVRIARELHDVVAHHVSVMGVQAGAARTVLDANPAAARDALTNVELGARSAIDELRKMLGTLRADGDTNPEDGPSTVGVGRLGQLADESSANGLPTRFERIGAPVPIPAVVSFNLYRIAQEALTNARKYGGTHATAELRLRYLTDAVELEVTNTGTVPASARPGGLGLIGMRERVASSGGVLEVGARTRGGFLVRAAIPLGRSGDQAMEPVGPARDDTRALSSAAAHPSTPMTEDPA